MSSAALTEERYGLILQYLRNKGEAGSYPDSFTANQKRGLRQQARSFEEKNGILYYCSVVNPKPRRVVVSKAEKQRLIKACHDGIDGGHFGRDKTTSKVCPTR